MNSARITVQVDRQTMSAKDVDLPSFLDSVYEAVLRNFQLFGAEEKFDIYPEEVSLSSIVVYNYRTRGYTRAAISTDEEGNVSLSKVERVRRTWVPIEEPVARSEGETEPETLAEFFPVEMVQRGNVWSSILGR